MHCSAAKLLLLIAAVISSLSLITQSAGCITHERDALLAFKRGFTRDPVGLLDSWRQGNQDCCQWRGIRCSNQTGHVHMLRLRTVDDAMPTYSNALTGQISPSLLALQHLEHLDLSLNHLDEVPIPEFLGSLKNLKYLNLSGTQFHGTIPPQLGNLSRLQYLDLSGMEGIDSADMSWLTRLASLRDLNLQGANLSKVADWPHVVNMIPSLRVLNLSSCSLTSANQSLPHLNLTNLQELDLSGNDFNHQAASCWFWNITDLMYLDLGFNDLNGHLPKALAGMTSLGYLSFRGNYHIDLMTGMKRLCSLRILDLQGCSLDGNIAELIDKLPHCSPNKLQKLYLARNQLTGVLPNSMEHLTSLVFLDLSMNKIVGPLPASIGHYLTSLVVLNLDSNSFTGPIPKSVVNFTSLRTLYLYNNNLTGRVPYEIGMLTNLTELDLSINYLDGVIKEDHFASTRSLEHIYLSGNSLKIELNSEWQPPFRLHSAAFATCQMGPLFPAWLQWHVGIQYLDISNTGIIDRLPHWFANAFSNATEVDISNNQLNGGLPKNMEIMSRLDILLLRSNGLIGQIPPLPRNLTVLDISNNSLSGPLPVDLPNLQMLSLFSNRITGRIPKSICKCMDLMILDLANNLLEGELPLCFGNGHIITLELRNNRFTGKLPSSIQNCRMLEALDLARNMFSGELPTWIGNLVSLRFIALCHNMFSGDIPINITRLEYLRYIDISNNELSGTLPSNLSSVKSNSWLPGLPDTFFATGSLNASTKGRVLNYVSIDRILDMDMVSIDLSSNNLTGQIPLEIATLDALVNLNLSRNHFSRALPHKIGDMQSLESIDFSRNNLSGDIPVGLSNLTFLSYLDLSYNNFSGRIPSGSQLDTLYAENPSMYNGNIGLCGPPIHKNCSSTGASEQGRLRTTEGGYEPEFFYFGLGCGFTAGIWVVFCALLFKRRWRITCFRLFDKLCDKVYVLVVVTVARYINDEDVQ